MISDVAPPPVEELRRDLGLAAARCEPRAGGFASHCWLIDDQWFLKTRRADSPPRDLRLLRLLRDRGLPVVPAVHEHELPTDDGRLYSVFPFVPGRHASDLDSAVVASALRHVHLTPFEGLDLPTRSLADERLDDLRSNLDHPWIRDRASELSAWLDRFDSVASRAVAVTAPVVLSHDDLGGHNLLLDESGNVAAMLDWDYACVGPREHDLWMVIDEQRPSEFLHAYGASEFALSSELLEYALLRRALGDLSARVCDELDRPGVDTWGFARLARLDATLALFS